MKRWKTICAVLVTALCIGAGGKKLPENDEAAWDLYEEEAKQAEAGEAVPTPDDPAWGKPWKKMCASNDSWCPSIAEGLTAGKTWCKKGNKCFEVHRKQAYELYLEWGPYIDRFAGGQVGLWVAQTIRTESFGDVFGKTRSSTWECGLASVDRDHAREANVNACDPVANIWATGWFRNKRLLALREALPEIKQAPLEDQWLLAGAGGAVGLGKVVELLKMSGAVRVKDGKLMHAHPYERLLLYIQTLHPKWKRAQGIRLRSKSIGLAAALKEEGLGDGQWKYLSSFNELYAKVGPFSKLFSWRPGRTAFRIARPYAVAQIFKSVFKDGKLPWGEPILPPRPKSITDYPGDKNHCRCYMWPDYEHVRPTQVEYSSWKKGLDAIDLLRPEEWK